jgi:hypothetical protein
MKRNLHAVPHNVANAPRNIKELRRMYSYQDVQIGPEEIKTLRQLIAMEGAEKVASYLEVGVGTMYKVMAGMIDYCRPATVQKLLEFFGGQAKL